MWLLIGLSVLQSLMLAVGQVALKIALARMPAFSWTSEFWLSLLTNWAFAACGALFAGASILWMYILKHYPLSMAYPLASISYVIAAFMAILVFHETVPMTRWIGVCLIMAGCALVAYK